MKSDRSVFTRVVPACPAGTIDGYVDLYGVGGARRHFPENVIRDPEWRDLYPVRTEVDTVRIVGKKALRCRFGLAGR